MSKPVILTGLRANNDLHLGNYLGSLRTIVELQQHYAGKFQINLFVPDLHSFTTPVEHDQLYQQTMHNLKLFVAAGLDLNDPDTFIYRQSHVSAHSELTVILNNFAYMGELSRMTQFKEKGEKQANVSVGLFDYPVLMAADILLYDAKYVPVGEDQAQHLELARDLAVRLNNKFDRQLFVVPEAYGVFSQFDAQQKPAALRIRNLIDPTKKMSKSDETGKGVLFLGDDPETAVKKIMGATTDNLASIKYDPANQPGVSNLLEILAHIENTAIVEVAGRYAGKTNYGDLKADVAAKVKEFLVDIQAKLAQVSDSDIDQKLKDSEAKLQASTQDKLFEVQKAIGLRK